ncbi:MAG TPA: hypothetical protein VK618_03005, partial [Flavitalea sp.]|nr:hypothetical protein [Flavitalea sp.]
MKSFYVLIVVCLGLTLNGNSQYVTWTGPAGGNWNNAANWTPAGVPNSASRITLPPNADISLDVSTSVHNIKVFSGWARISGVGGDQLLTLTGTDTALFIAPGATLRDSSASTSSFGVEFATGSKGLVRGTWYFGAPDDGGSYVEFPASGTPACEVFGTMQFADNALAGVNGNTTLHFNSGSTLQLTTIQPVIPAADYDPNSLIYISGVVTNPVSFEELTAVGNLTYACPNQMIDLTLGMSGMTIGGNLFITNTNGKKLTMFFDVIFVPVTFSNTVNGNLQVSGPSRFLVSEAIPSALGYNLFINGNLTMGGLEFDMQSAASTSTNLFVKGNIQHTAGSFKVSSPSASSGANYFNIELNGAGNQILSSVDGSLTDNLQVNLRINKTTGSVSLASPIAVGRLQFTSTNKANINTGINLLSVRKLTSPGDLVALRYDAGNTGFVEGTLQRSFATTESILFPLGTGTTYRPLKFNPSSSDSSIYQASQVNGAYPADAIFPPLTGVAPYYWNLIKNTGADGNVELTLNGQVPGATSGDALVAAKLATNNWVNARGSAGTTISDGSVTTGTVKTEPQTSYGYYTIGYGSHASLPVILTAFNAKKVSASAADITWKITQNSTPEMFDVMRSSDG